MYYVLIVTVSSKWQSSKFITTDALFFSKMSCNILWLHILLKILNLVPPISSNTKWHAVNLRSWTQTTSITSAWGQKKF